MHDLVANLALAITLLGYIATYPSYCKMSQQLSVPSSFRKPNKCIVVNKQGENRGIYVVESEEQASNTDNIYLPTAANAILLDLATLL